MNQHGPPNQRKPTPDVSQALENSLQRGFSHGAWIVVLVVIFNVCGVIGGIASLFDRLIQGEDYVPYIGVITGAVLFVLSGFGSTSMLPPRERSAAVSVMGVLTFFVIIVVRIILTSMSK